MGDAFVKALTALENGQAMPLAVPGGDARCPLGRIRMGIFFDGTGNNMWTDLKRENGVMAKPEGERMLPPGEAANGATNVVHLYLKYGPRQPPVLDKAYHHGVGTDYDGKVPGFRDEIQVDPSLDPTMGQTMDGKPKGQTQDRKGDIRGTVRGHGGKARIEWGIRMLAEFYSYNNNEKAKEKFYDVFGFSRGAALARDFVNQVRTQLIPNLNKKAPSSYFTIDYWKSVGSEKQEANAEKDNYMPFSEDEITAKFMGVYDTVSQFGWETGTFLLDVDHTHVEYCVHFIAEDEFRKEFPLTSIFMDPKTKDDWFSRYQEPRDYKKWMSEFWYPGCHSDIGGSYLDRSDIPAGTFFGVTYRDEVKGKKGDIQLITRWDMYRAMVRAKVPIETIDKPSGECYKLYLEYCAFRADKDWANHLENPQGQYIHTFETEAFMDRCYGPKGLHSLWSKVVPRSTSTAHQALRKTYIHDSQTEMVEADLISKIIFLRAPRADSDGNLPRLQRPVLYAGAQPKFSRNQPVRPPASYLPTPKR